MTGKLPDYLRIERKRAGLSQADVARLLDSRVLTVRRYEQRKRLPPLDTALAYEVIFGKPVAHLFAGRYRMIDARVREVAQARAQTLSRESTARAARRKESLNILAKR